MGDESFNNNLSDQLRYDLDLLIEEKRIVNKRIMMSKETLNEIPSTHPKYSILKDNIDIDQIESDELQFKIEAIEERIKSL